MIHGLGSVRSFFPADLKQRVLKNARGLFEPLVFVRVGLCLILLFRHEDLLRGFIELEHHSWGPGPEFGAHSLAPSSPAFVAPLIPGFDGLLPYSDLLCRIRLALTCLLLLGVLPRLNALLLALVSFSIFAADGFRYLHHLLILSVSVLFLALPHVRGSKSGKGEASDSTGSLALLTLRAHVMVAYFFAGLAKCMDSWLSGATLRALHEPAFATGPVMDASVRAVGYAGLSWGACLVELGAPFLLAFGKTRHVGVLLALSLHAFVHATILVSTFGITMAVLLGAFLPTAEERRGPVMVPKEKYILAFTLAAALPLFARAYSTGVGSYSMFTRLVHYTLEMRVDETPFRRAQLAEHMGRDGARIVRLANGRGIGETNVEILKRSLPRLSTFLCTLNPGAQRTSVSLRTERIEGGSVTQVQRASECH